MGDFAAKTLWGVGLIAVWGTGQALRGLVHFAGWAWYQAGGWNIWGGEQ